VTARRVGAAVALLVVLPLAYLVAAFTWCRHRIGRGIELFGLIFVFLGAVLQDLDVRQLWSETYGAPK
jgi:hypothetical protein